MFPNPRSPPQIANSVPTNPNPAANDRFRPHVLTKLMAALFGSRTRELPDAARSGSNRDRTPIPLYPS